MRNEGDRKWHCPLVVKQKQKQDLAYSTHMKFSRPVCCYYLSGDEKCEQNLKCSNHLTYLGVDNAKMCPKQSGYKSMNSIELTQIREQWGALVNL
jgi:hypothetical protein